MGNNTQKSPIAKPGIYKRLNKELDDISQSRGKDTPSLISKFVRKVRSTYYDEETLAAIDKKKSSQYKMSSKEKSLFSRIRRMEEAEIKKGSK